MADVQVDNLRRGAGLAEQFAYVNAGLGNDFVETAAGETLHQYSAILQLANAQARGLVIMCGTFGDPSLGAGTLDAIKPAEQDVNAHGSPSQSFLRRLSRENRLLPFQHGA